MLHLFCYEAERPKSSEKRMHLKPHLPPIECFTMCKNSKLQALHFFAADMALLRGALVILGLASVKSSPLLEVKLSDDGGCLEIEG